MIEPIIHIGYAKTASRWLQKEIFSKDKSISILSKEQIFSKIIMPNDLVLDFNQIRKYFEEKYRGKILLSSPGFIGTTHFFGLNNYVTRENAIRLNKIFPDAKIMIIIRNQSDIIASSYIQYLKEGGTYSIKNYLKSSNSIGLNNVFSFYYSYFEYHYLIDLYVSLFGKENVYIYLFEDFVNESCIFIKRVINDLGISIKLNEIDFTIINKKYRKYLISLIKIRNSFTKKNVLRKSFILHIPGLFELTQRLLGRLNNFKIFGSFTSTKKILGNEIYSDIMQRYKNSNTILIEKYELKNILNFKYPI